MGPATILRLQELLISIKEGGEGCWAGCSQELWLLLPASPDLAPTTSAIYQGQAKGNRIVEDDRARSRLLEKLVLIPVSTRPCLMGF